MIKITPPADEDFEGIYQHIAEDSPEVALHVIRRIVAVFKRIEAFPNIGRPGQRPNTRELVVPRLPYIVVYRHKVDLVTILRIMHDAQSWPKP